MSKPLPTPADAVALTAVLARHVDAEIEVEHRITEVPTVEIQFEDRLPELVWLEAVSVVTGMFASRDITLNFVLYDESGQGVKKARIILTNLQ